jgi:hypothetical protein
VNDLCGWLLIAIGVTLFALAYIGVVLLAFTGGSAIMERIFG